MDELDEMKAQMALLKQKLDNQIILSDTYLRRITSERVQRLNRAVWIEGACCLFVVTFGNITFYRLGCSVPFMVATTMLMVASFLLTLIPHCRVRCEQMGQCDLLTVAKQIRRLRRLYQRWLYIGIPLVLGWATWLGLEIFRLNSEDMSVFYTTMIGLLAGGVIGGGIGYAQHRKLVKEMDTIIRDIEQE